MAVKVASLLRPDVGCFENSPTRWHCWSSELAALRPARLCPARPSPGNFPQETGGPKWAGATGILGGAPFSLRARLLFRESDCRETKDDSRALGEILDLKKMIRNPTPSRIWHSEFAKSLKKKKNWLHQVLAAAFRVFVAHVGSSLVVHGLLSSCSVRAQ